MVKRVCPRAKTAEWLPVPCTLDAESNPEAVAAARVRYASPAGGPLVGHFGTFGRSITDLLGPVVNGLLGRMPDARVLLVGRNSEQAAAGFGDNRVTATGPLPSAAVSIHLRACDLLVQPFPDGVSSRRTSAMAGLANGVPVVTNLGPLSEPVWAGGAVAAAPEPDPSAVAALAADLANDPKARAELGRRGANLYRETFALEQTIARLRGAP
jgi:glycosyltransferase involved in cell wall biosynthesis